MEIPKKIPKKIRLQLSGVIEDACRLGWELEESASGFETVALRKGKKVIYIDLKYSEKGCRWEISFPRIKKSEYTGKIVCDAEEMRERIIDVLKGFNRG